MTERPVCKIQGCERPFKARGFCIVHYSRWKRTGDPGDAAPVVREPEPCGTYGAYQRHMKNGEEACEPCRIARNAYMANRRTDPAIRAKELRKAYARDRALARLARDFPAIYQRYYSEEMGES